MRLRIQLALMIFVIGVVGMVIRGVDRAGATREVLRSRAESRANAIAEVAESLVSRAMQRGDLNSMQGSLDALLRLPGVIDIHVFDREGKIVSRAQSPTAAMPRGPGVSGEAVIPASDDIIDLVFHDALGRVKVRVSKQNLENKLLALHWRDIAFGAASLVALVVLSWLVGRLLGRRLDSMADAVRQLENGTPLKLADGGSDSEADRLSRAINSLQQRLSSEMERRKKLETFKDDLTNMLVHDMKHPVTVLTTLVALLEDDQRVMSEEKRASLLRMAKRNIRRENDMIEDLLQVARLANPEMLLQKKRLALPAFIEECAKENSLIAEQAQREWRVEIDGQMPACWIYADEALIRRVIGNLVLNAVEHSPAGSRVTLGLRLSKRDRAKAEIFVSDQGPGVPANRREAIFLKYRSFAESAKHVGLGLAYCRLAAEKHSARLELLETPGPGATFALVIPISIRQAALPAQEAAAPSGSAEPAQGREGSCGLLSDRTSGEKFGNAAA